jgi:hypothetical protein
MEAEQREAMMLCAFPEELASGFVRSTPTHLMAMFIARRNY